VLQELGESFLDRASLEVRTAPNGAAALTLASSWKPAVVVVRSRLPDQSAASLCSALAQTPEPPRVLLVGDALDPSDDTARCDVHLVSPVTPEELLESLAQLASIDSRRSSRVALDVLVHLEGLSAPEVGIDASPGSTVNLSEDGMLVEANCPLAVGRTGLAQFFLPGASERMSLRATARLAVDARRMRYWLEFVDLAPHHRLAIRGFVQGSRE